MKVFRYFGPLFMLCVLQFIVDSNGRAETKQPKRHVKQPSNVRRENIIERDLKPGRIVAKKTKDGGSTVKKQGTLSINSKNGERHIGKEAKAHVNLDLVGGISKKHFAQADSLEGPKGKVIGTKSASFQTSNITNSKSQEKYKKLKLKDNAAKKKEKVYKKYALFQSFPSLESQPNDYQSIITGGDADADYSPQTDQTGQELPPNDQQQQPLSGGNSLMQFEAPQDSTAYQQENSQSSVANFAASNDEDTGQSEGGQPSSLEQPVQLQQAAYTQHPREQGQDQDNISPNSQNGELAGQESPMIEAGQLQYQGEQTGQGQEESDQRQGDQEQGPTQTSFEQAGFQQEQQQQIDQQQSQGIDQQQQDQTQEYQQQQQQEEQQQQPGVEPQASEGASYESPSLTTSSNSYGGLLSTAGQQTAQEEQQGQGTLSYTNEQSSDAGDKSPEPGVQYASSIEEALKEPPLSPEETNSDGGDGQRIISATEGGNTVSTDPEPDSKEGGKNGFIGAGSISSPTGYQTSIADDNGNPVQTGTGNEINGYAPSNDQASNGAANGLEENQELQSATSTESQNELNFVQQQFQHQSSKPNVPPLEDDVYKILNIENKNGPTAGKLAYTELRILNKKILTLTV